MAQIPKQATGMKLYYFSSSVENHTCDFLHPMGVSKVTECGEDKRLL